MAIILNIETSGSPCSAALTSDGMILAHREDFTGRNHAAALSDFIKYCLDYGAEQGLRPDAVAVSLGPGSYTGLRIGLSEAKGLAYALDVPLIGVKTLELLATRVMFSTDAVDSDSILIPMVDARRMEVYTGAYDFGMAELMKPGALILDKDSYAPLKASGRPILYFGSGAEKPSRIWTAVFMCLKWRLWLSIWWPWQSLHMQKGVYRYGLFSACISQGVPSYRG